MNLSKRPDDPSATVRHPTRPYKQRNAPSQLERHHRIRPRPTTRQRLPKRRRTRRRNRLPSQAQQPRHRTRQQTRRHLVHRSKHLVADREPCHMHDVLQEVSGCFSAAVLDVEWLGEVLERC